MLAAALGFVAYRQRPRTSPHEKFEPALKSAASPIEPHQPVSATTATPVTSTATSVLNLPAIIPRQQPLAAVDTPAALKALAIADSYIADVRDNFDNEDFPAHRTTLSLAARQLDIAAKADPSARHVSEIGNEYAQDEMRARVLVQEALTWAAEKTSKACTIAERACALDPNSTHAHYVAGWLNFEHKNRDRAISLLTRAVELAPNNLDAIKLLDRAQNMTAAEIATYKATAATEGTIKAARKTWNVIKFLAWLLTVFVVFNALYACSQLKSPHQPGADASFNYLIGSWAALMALGAIMRGWDWVKAWFGRNSL